MRYRKRLCSCVAPGRYTTKWINFLMYPAIMRAVHAAPPGTPHPECQDGDR